MNIEVSRNGKGTQDPGEGMQAVRAPLISYPSSHSNSIGIQPSPASFFSKASGQSRPSNSHFHLRTPAFGVHFSGQY
jgi:hypothetical protein